MRGIDKGFALSFGPPKVQSVIRTAFLTIDTMGMDQAIGVNRVSGAHRAEFLLFFRLLTDGPVRRKNFIPIFIALLHCINLALVLRAIRMAGRFAKMLG